MFSAVLKRPKVCRECVAISWKCVVLFRDMAEIIIKLSILRNVRKFFRVNFLSKTFLETYNISGEVNRLLRKSQGFPIADTYKCYGQLWSTVGSFIINWFLVKSFNVHIRRKCRLSSQSFCPSFCCLRELSWTIDERTKRVAIVCARARTSARNGRIMHVCVAINKCITKKPTTLKAVFNGIVKVRCAHQFPWLDREIQKKRG